MYLQIKYKLVLQISRKNSADIYFYNSFAILEKSFQVIIWRFKYFNRCFNYNCSGRYTVSGDLNLHTKQYTFIPFVNIHHEIEISNICLFLLMHTSNTSTLTLSHIRISEMRLLKKWNAHVGVALIWYVFATISQWNNFMCISLPPDSLAFK